MANYRIYYAVHQVAIKGDDEADWTFESGDVVHGVQNVSIDTNFDLQQVFELGQQAIYENIEELPDVTVTLNKVLDGYPLLYHLATQDATGGNTLAGRSTAKCMFGLGIWPDTNESCDGTDPPSILACSGMYVGSATYNFPLEDNFNEEITLVGNHKIWLKGDDHLTDVNATLPWDSITMAGAFAGNNDEPQGTGGVNRRQDLIFETGSDATGVNSTVLPADVYGISSSGTNNKDANGDFSAHLSNITVSTDFNREEINELGRKGPYHRSVNFPIEVTCEIEVTSSSGDMVSAVEDGIYKTGTGFCDEGGNLVNRVIRLATCEGTRIYLGNKNKLASVNYSGGDAGGGNVAVTYTFTTFNDFTILHSGDPHTSGSTWWTNRGDSGVLWD